MNKTRLEAFSDGVIAIIITIMVLELKVPNTNTCNGILELFPELFTYMLSFILVGIYWNNHHHLFQAIKRVNGAILWGNLHLLFWLSLLPVSTAWMGENFHSAWPVAFYGFILLMSSIAFMIIEKVAVKTEGKESIIGKSVSKNIKEMSSCIGYILGIVVSFFKPEIGIVIYYLIALIWLIPDRRIEKVIE